jgi:hypothetical protein
MILYSKKSTDNVSSKAILTSSKDLHSILNQANVKAKAKDSLRFKTIWKSWKLDKIWINKRSLGKSLPFKNGGKE